MIEITENIMVKKNTLEEKYKNKIWLTEELLNKNLTEIAAEQGVARNTIKYYADSFELTYGGRGRKLKYSTDLEKKVANKNKVRKYLDKLKKNDTIQFKVMLTDVESDRLRLMKNKFKCETYQDLFMVLMKEIIPYQTKNKRPLMPNFPPKSSADYKLYYVKQNTVNKVNKLKNKFGMETGEFFSLIIYILSR
jgi:hypothetical protein